MDDKWYLWGIMELADGTYRFVTPENKDAAFAWMGKNGGGYYTHAGYLVVAANKWWWQKLTKEYDKKYHNATIKPPHIDVPNIDCAFSQASLEWLKRNEAALKEKGGKYYANIPRH